MVNVTFSETFDTIVTLQDGSTHVYNNGGKSAHILGLLPNKAAPLTSLTDISWVLTGTALVLIMTPGNGCAD